MLTTLILVFVVAYTAIALEHPLKVNKSASALLGAGLLWTIYAVGAGDSHLVNEQLAESRHNTMTQLMNNDQKYEYEQPYHYRQRIAYNFHLPSVPTIAAIIFF